MIGDYLIHKIDALRALIHGNSLTEWLIAGIVFVAVWSVLWIARRVVASRYKKYTAAGHRGALRLLAYLAGNTKQFFNFAIALAAAEPSLTLPDKIQHIIANLVLVLILLQVGLWAGRAVRFYLETKEQERGPDQVFAGSLDIINFVARILIWSLVLLVALDNMGVNITALLAGLGVGGVAVALALQNILGDLFASLSIALDKPFVVGDRLEIDTFGGKVERIGIKTTRLRSDSGEQIILSNADILKSRVRNFARAEEQRTLATIRVSYETSTGIIKGIPKLIEGIVREQPNARFDRCHLKTLGDSALLFELAYFVRQPSVNSSLDLQQAVNLRILEEFRRLDVDVAYQAQHVIHNQPAPAEKAPAKSPAEQPTSARAPAGTMPPRP
jgi:small-conductance mechanosensitive channel